MQESADGRGPDKLLAIGAYGEAVAAYRYVVLSEKSPNAAGRRRFAGMADEEQEQKQLLQRELAERFPEADCVLTAADKALVVSGPRLLNVHGLISFAETLNMVLETERKTADFYARHGPLISDGTLRSLFHRLAEDSARCYRRLEALVVEKGIPAAGRGEVGG